MSSKSRGLRLGFLSARAAHANDRGVFTQPGVARLINVWRADGWDVVVAMSDAPTCPQLFTDRVDVSPDRYHPLPYLPSLAGGFHKAYACRARIRTFERACDVVIVQLPFAAPLALLGSRTPRVYHVCADILRSTTTSPYYRGPTRSAAIVVAKGIDRLQRHLIWRKGSRGVTNGEALFRHYGCPPGRSVVSATISQNEILSVLRTRTDGRFRVLYVGYMRPEKGVDTLLDAFSALLSRVPEAQLCVVGETDSVDRGVGNAVKERIDAWSRTGQATFLGPRAFGPELFSCFANADVLVVPSRSEGTPRVIGEARALGCPVVASRVGGIPSVIRNGEDGLLVPPDDPDALFQALWTLANDGALRRRLIDTGVARARNETVEAYARHLSDEARVLVDGTR